MAELTNELLAIEVDADDYAETAAGDAPTVSRTHQSEADFEAQKAAYSAKIDNGNHYDRLLEAFPSLKAPTTNGDGHKARARLGKKETQLLGYAVGELYYDWRYQDLIRLCEMVEQSCETDDKLADSLRRWTRRCEERLRS